MRYIFVFQTFLPACKVPSSAACPVGNTVLTKMPIFPLGESRPPTILKPRDFMPGPLKKVTILGVPLREP